MHCILLICQKEYSPATPSMVLLPFVLGMIFLLSFETLIEGVAEEGCGDGEDIFIIQVDNTTQYQAYAEKFGKNNVKIVNKHSLQVYASCENMRYHHYHHHQQPQYKRKEPTEKLHQHFLHANKRCRRRPRAAMTGVHIHSPPRPPSPHNMYRNVIIYNNQPPPRGLGLSMAEVDVLPEVPTSLNTNSSDPLLVHAQKIGDVENNSNYNNPLLRQPSAPPFDANAMTPITSNSRTKEKKEQERPMYA